MGGFSLWHWLIVLLVVLILFGRGRVSEIMGDFGKGIKSFKKGLNEDDTSPLPPAHSASRCSGLRSHACATRCKRNTSGRNDPPQ